MRCPIDKRLGHVDLHVRDVLAVPDRLEQTVREPEREDVERGFLAEEVVDAEDLALVERLRAASSFSSTALGEVGAERLLHDDARALGEPDLAEQLARPPARPRAERSGSAGARRRRRARPRARRRSSPAPRCRPTGRRRRAAPRTRPSRRRARRGARTRRARRGRTRGNPSSSRSSSDVPTIRHSGSRPGLREVEQPGQELAAGEVAGGAEQHHHVRAQRRDQARVDVGRVRRGHAHSLNPAAVVAVSVRLIFA